jgi:hypothetical protein
MAVLGVEHLDLAPASVEMELAVGQDAVDVDEERPDARDTPRSGALARRR